MKCSWMGMKVNALRLVCKLSSLLWLSPACMHPQVLCLFCVPEFPPNSSQLSSNCSFAMEEADPQMEAAPAKEPITFPVAEEEPGEPSRLDVEREKHRQRLVGQLQGDAPVVHGDAQFVTD